MQTPASPATPAPPSPAPGPPAFEGVTVQAQGAPAIAPSAGGDFATPARNAAEYARFEIRKSELSEQLISATGRREELADQLSDASGASRAGLEQRLAVLDGRIVELERDIQSNGQMLAMPPIDVAESGSLVSPAVFDDDSLLSSDQITAIAIVFLLFVLGPIALAAARRIWRGATTKQVPVLGTDASARLERVEQGVESIAIEIERISDGQRFVTRLLGEARPSSIETGGRVPDPVLVSRMDASRGDR